MARPFTFAVRSTQAQSIADLRRRARHVEQLGYFAFHVSDHVLGPGPAIEQTGHPPADLAAIPMLMAIADATERLRIGARVMSIDYHHPVILAKEMATIDFFSEGRVEVGLGAGWLRGEYEALGIPFDPAPQRIERLGEAIQLMKLLFAGGQVSFHGKHFQVHGFEGAPLPVQRPRPPIAIGGGGPKVLRLAGREADIVSINYDNRSGLLGADGVSRSTAAATKQKIEWIRQGAADRADGVEIEIGVYFTVVTDDAVGAAERLSSSLGLPPDEILQHPHALIGTIDGICEQVEQRRADYGISYFTIGEPAAAAFAPVVERLAGK